MDLFAKYHDTNRNYCLTCMEGEIGEGRPKWAPEVKWATPITANMVKAMAKIMMPVSSPSREGTMECVACELQHKNKQ